MTIFLPIAGISVNIFLLIGIGGVVGFLSGLFGVGGGFLLTPLMMMIGIPPAVAAASDSNQIVAAAASGAAAHWRMGNVNIRMGLIILAGGLVGSTVGVQAVKVLRELGNFDFVIRVAYVVLLGSVGTFMLIESIRTMRKSRAAVPGSSEPPEIPPHGAETRFSKWPLQVNFPKMHMRTSALFPFIVGIAVGFLAAIMGVGGGVIMIPVMIYVIGMPTVMAIGTDLFQIVLTTANVTIQQAVANRTVDVMLAVLLFSGSVVGAQIGARVSKNIRGEKLRVYLSIIILVVMVKILFDLLAVPDNVIALVPAIGGH